MTATTNRVEELAWREFPIPGSTPPVTMTRLHTAEDGGFSVLVRFPAGWERPGLGVYDAAEEVLFLEGGFRMSGVDHGPGAYGWFPAGYPRDGSSSAGGALALAWFSGRNRWTPLDTPPEDPEGGVVRGHWPSADLRPSPLGTGEALLLRDGPEHASWVVTEVPAHRPSPVSAELFGLDERVWSLTEAGAPLPRLAGPAFCRVRGRASA